MMKALGLTMLVVLILVGALMPLKYTARMQLPERKPTQGTRSPELDEQ